MQKKKKENGIFDCRAIGIAKSKNSNENELTGTTVLTSPIFSASAAV